VSRPEAALDRLAELLREEQTVISEHIVETDAEPAIGMLVAAGSRAKSAPEEYAFVVEAIREGYLLHYGEARVVSGADSDLALLAGDYLYATGIDRLAALGDIAAVTELADLISLSAQLHAGPEPANGEVGPALWLAAAVAIGTGHDDEEAKRAAREGDSEAAGSLWQAAREGAGSESLLAALDHACEAIGFDVRNLSEN
jgi:hypothetical protein